MSNNPELYQFDSTEVEPAKKQSLCWMCFYEKHLDEIRAGTPEHHPVNNGLALRRAIQDVIEQSVVFAGQAVPADSQPSGSRPADSHPADSQPVETASTSSHHGDHVKK